MSRTSGRIVGAVAVLVLLLAAAPAASAPSPVVASRFDLVSSAQPSAAGRVSDDRADRADETVASSPRAHAVATASALCRRCHGDARTVQVIWAGSAWRVRADNAAVAWSGCRTCGAAAVSLQLVLTRHPVALTVNNRALAVDVACDGCDTAAEAYQLVVMTDQRPPLDRLRDELTAWVDELDPRAATAPTVRRSGAADGAASLDGLGRLVTEAVGGTVLASSRKADG